MFSVPSECPVCHDDLLVTELVCRHCGTVLRNRFEMDRLSRLMPEQRHFVEVFLLCEGKINCVQEELGISYPTVRGRLDEIIQALRRRVAVQEPVVHVVSPARQEILDRLGRQEITAEEALQLLEEA
ncbi:MAG: DUF2089 domain-containing protein [Anaerolineae bacterium]|nr:DUF2089 domain-containing protein [Anaerolineae bacterium]